MKSVAFNLVLYAYFWMASPRLSRQIEYHAIADRLSYRASICTAWCVVGLGLTISKNKFSKPKKMIFLAYNYHVIANILENITKRV